MSDEPAFNARLGSFTSGVDGSSEGGRINTMRVPGAISLYGVALVNHLKASGYRSPLTFAVGSVDGIWTLELEYDGDEAPAAPDLWHSHRVIVRRKPPQPKEEQKK